MSAYIWAHARMHVQFRYGFDVVADLDLHIDGSAALSAYMVLVISGHSEYWSREMVNALDRCHCNSVMFSLLLGIVLIMLF